MCNRSRSLPTTRRVQPIWPIAAGTISLPDRWARSDESGLGDLGSEELAGRAVPLVGPEEISGPDGPVELDSAEVCLVGKGAAAGILTPRMSTRLGPAGHGQRTKSTVGPDSERDRQRLIIDVPFRHDRF